MHCPTWTPSAFRSIGSCKGQAIWEALALLVAIRVWVPLVAQMQIQLLVRCDSTAAIAVALRMCSPKLFLNGIGAEIALLFEKHAIDELVLEHIPRRLNVQADILSRLFA